MVQIGTQANSDWEKNGRNDRPFFHRYSAYCLAGLGAAAIGFVFHPALAAEADSIPINQIADSGYRHSQAVETVRHLTDHIGPRLTNSPAMRAAETWALERFQSWGLKKVRREGFEFGRGWWIERSTAWMVAPRIAPLRVIPIAWTPATAGPMTGSVILAPMINESDFEKWRGKLTGKIVLISSPGEPADDADPPFQRLTDQELNGLSGYPQPPDEAKALQRRIERRAFPQKIDAFLRAEGALAWARISPRGNRIVHGEGYLYKTGETPSLPALEIAAEDYRRLARLSERDAPKIEFESRVHFDDSDSKAYNLFADIPGTEPKNGYVLAGAHLDSWVAGDGAADNAAGCAIVMEAARILSSLGVRPKRTIRFVLWAGEEQGMLGSLAFVATHIARRGALNAAPTEPYASLDAYPVIPQQGYEDLVAYFNVDNGGGRIRGIYGEANLAAVPVLREWLSPLASIGVSSVTLGYAANTDHVGLARAGLPAFQFIQDPLDYKSRVHHSDLDTFDHLREQDIKQAAVVLATVLLSAANSSKRLPRDVIPKEPARTSRMPPNEPARH